MFAFIFKSRVRNRNYSTIGQPNEEFQEFFRSPYSQPKAKVQEQGQPRVNQRIVDCMEFIECFAAQLIAVKTIKGSIKFFIVYPWL